MKALYFEMATLLERMHRQFMDMLKVELDRMHLGDINNVQAIILYNVGRSELSVGELSNRGYYLGSNVSYNLRKLVENGYFIQEKAKNDKRASKIRLSEKGLKLYDKLDVIITKHADNLRHNGMSEESITDSLKLMRKLEAYWGFIISNNVGGY